MYTGVLLLKRRAWDLFGPDSFVDFSDVLLPRKAILGGVLMDISDPRKWGKSYAGLLSTKTPPDIHLQASRRGFPGGNHNCIQDTSRFVRTRIRFRFETAIRTADSLACCYDGMGISPPHPLVVVGRRTGPRIPARGRPSHLSSARGVG